MTWEAIKFFGSLIGMISCFIALFHSETVIENTPLNLACFIGVFAFGLAAFGR